MAHLRLAARCVPGAIHKADDNAQGELLEQQGRPGQAFGTTEASPVNKQAAAIIKTYLDTLPHDLSIHVERNSVWSSEFPLDRGC